MKKTNLGAKILSLLLVLCMAVMLPVTAMAADSEVIASEEGDYAWTLTADGTLTISGQRVYPGDPDSQLSWWYDYRDVIKRIVINEGPTRIWPYTFAGLYNVTSVSLPDSLTDICHYAFGGCTSLTDITIPVNAWLEGSVFKGCTSLEAIGVAEDNPNLCAIDGVVYDKELTRNVAVPKGITGSLTIPEGVLYVGTPEFGHFDNCTKLTSVTIPASVREITTFAGCTSLKSIIFKGDAPYLGQSMFRDVTLNAYYPAGNATWTEYASGQEVRQNYGGTVTWIPYYPVLEGDGSTVTENAGGSITVRTDIPRAQFQSVDVDGETLDPACYDVSEGSTVITLHSDYLDTLAVGEHTLTAHFTDGVAMAKFTVESAATEPADPTEPSEPAAPTEPAKPDPSNPQTGSMELALLSALLLTSAAGMICLTRKKRV